MRVSSVQVWRQKAQYLQHKQNKAEATTIKHKTTNDSKSKGMLILTLAGGSVADVSSLFSLCCTVRCLLNYVLLSKS